MIFHSTEMTYLKRYIFWNSANITDYKKFPYQEIFRGEPVFSFNNDENKQSNALDLLKTIEYQYKNKTIRCPLDILLDSTGTTAFIIIKDDLILYEKYFNHYLRDSINTSFSISKSVTSLLVGIAIDQGFIRGVEDRVVDYIPELKNKVSDGLSLKHLLSMSSGIRYNIKHYPWADEPKSYHYPDLESLVIKSADQEYQQGSYFEYVNYNVILLGIILKRATKVSPHEYLQNKIWKPIEMEFSATWSVDSKTTKFPKMESGINARSIDFAKIGRLFLNSGIWNNNRIVSENWIKESTSPPELKADQYYIFKNHFPYSLFFKDKRFYYKYGWWGLKKNGGNYDFMAMGVLGQFIYVCPQKRMIIVRNGRTWGKINSWHKLFEEIVEKF